MMVPWPQYGHRRGSICNGISLTPDWTCFRSLVNATKRSTGVVARLALDHLCRVRIARLAFPCPQNQYRTKKEYIFPPSSRRILPQSTRLAGLERIIGPSPRFPTGHWPTARRPITAEGCSLILARFSVSIRRDETNQIGRSGIMRYGHAPLIFLG